MSLKEVCGANQSKVIDTIFEGGWCQGKDLGDLDTLDFSFRKQSIDGKNISEKVSEPDVKKLLAFETSKAIEQGVFGVPTVIIDGNLFGEMIK